MSKLIEHISKHKILSFLLVVCMILSILPMLGASATVSGITYYEHNFEFPLYGATGCPVKDVPGITAGTAFTILEEQGTNLKVKLKNGTETTIAKSFCMINLPDVVPSIKYDITNSYSSIFKIRGANIAGITGQSLYQYGTSKKNNPRLGKSEFLVSVLYDTAIKIAAAQKAALANDYTLVVYEAYRPTYAQDKLYAAYSPLVTTAIRGDFPVSWFAASGKSNHQEGYAVDLTLAKVTAISFTTLSNPVYKIATLTVTPCTMITPIHDLTVDAAVYNYQSGMVIYDKTAWQSYTKTTAFAGNADCQRLQKYMTDAGLTPFAAEWWHFNDIDARNALGDLSSITGGWELTQNMSILNTSAAVTALAATSGSSEILIQSDDYDSSAGGTYYPHVIHLSGGSTRYPGVISPSDDIVTSNGYYIDDNGDKIFAFCIDPAKDGAAEVDGGSYYVTLSQKLTDKFEIAALKLSARSDASNILYPGQSFANMDYWVNYAVKIAVKFYEMTGQDEVKTLTEINNLTAVSTPTGSSFIPNDANFGSKVIAAIKAAYNWIIANENAAAVPGEEYWIGIPDDSNLQRYVFVTYTSETPEITTETTTAETTEPTTEETTIPTEPTTPEAPKTGSLKIGKINGTTGEPVPGTKFLVEQIDGAYSTTVTAGNDGYCTINDIPRGSYKITELYVPAPLILDTTPKSVYIDPETATADNPIVVEFVNDQMTCVHIYKFDSKTNEPLNGAQFQLSRKDETSAIFTGITGESKCTDCGLCKTPCDADGMICFGPLSPGWYTVREVNPAPGYIIDTATPSAQTFEVTGKETQEIELKFDNKRRPELKIIKKDPEGNHLPNVEFEIWKSGTQEKFSAKTDSNGEIYIAWDNADYPLSEGAYSIREINVPAGYVLSDEVKEVMLVGNTLSEVVFVNPKKPGLTITKTDNDGKPFDGVTFEIWKSGTDTKYSVTTAGGKIVLEWDNIDFPLEAGSYSIREVSVPRGYILDTTVKEALLENGKMVNIPFMNNKRPELEITKTDSTGKSLSGAVFTIKRAGTTTEYELTTDNQGKIVIPYDSPLYPLEADRYIVTEKTAPEHYIVSANNSQEVILEPNTRKTVTFVNLEKPKLTIEKYDKRGDGNGGLLPLSAVTFRVWTTDGSYDQNLTTGPDGKIRITDLILGEYHIQETSTKDGYVLNTEVRTVILKGDDDVTETFYNDKRPELLITKLDSKTNAPLQGAHFKISKGDEVLFDDLVTNADGEIYMPYNDPSRLLQDGVYKVTETAPPPGYDIVQPASQNVVLRNGECTRVEFSDVRKPTLVITKLNALTQKAIPNTLYNIKWEDSAGGIHDLGNQYTNKNGQIILPFVEVGWYVVTEIKPAPGMSKASNPVNRIYLAPGTNSYSLDELQTSDNSSVQSAISSTPITSGVTASDPHADYSEYFNAVTLESEPIQETVLSADEIETREYADGDIYIDSNYPAVQIGSIGDTFTDNSDNSFILSAASDTVAFAATDNPGIIIDYPLNSLIIKKEDATNGNLLAGAHFEIYRMSDETSGQSGTLIARVITGNSGIVAITGLEAGVYFVKEVHAPDNYTLSIQGVQTAYFVPDQTSNIEFTFTNYPFGSILVDKTDAVTNKPLAGARFELTKADGAHIAYSTTDNYGHAVFTNLEPGAYVVSEQEAPADYQIDAAPQTVDVPANGEMQTVYFKNQPFGSLVIVKKDAVLKTPIGGVKFHITDIHGANIGDITTGNGFAADGIYTTDGNGEIKIDHIPQGDYLITEIYAPAPYLIDDTPKVVYAEFGKIKTAEFWNSKTGALVISKYDAVTKMPLKNAVFMVTDSKGAVVGKSGGLFKTDDTGHIYLYDLTPGSYKIYEEAAPDGFILDNTVKTIDITDEKMYYLEFFNEPVNSFTIMKYDSETRQPLQGAVIRVQKLGSTTTLIGDFITDMDGMIVIDDLLPGAYSVQEIQAPKNYVLDNTVINISLEQNKPQVVTMYNKPYGSLVIRKVETDTLIPLEGAEFSVKAQNGQIIGNNYRSDANGTVKIDNLAPGFYTVTEEKAPENYTLGDNVQTIEVKSGVIAEATFQNRPFGSLVIKKVDKITGKPLTGAQFTVYHQGGAFVGEYETGADGTINISAVEPDYYVVTETRAPQGYMLENTGKTVEVKAVVPTVTTFTNAPLSGIEILKTDAVTHEALTGATFLVERSNGEKIGTFKTDSSGKIIVSDLSEDAYIVSETISPDGYIRDELPKTVTVVSGKLTSVEFTNMPYGNLTIKKTNEITGEPLSGAEFTVAKQNGEFIGNFTTASDGTIVVQSLEPGYYTIGETKCPQGYILDKTPKTIEVKPHIPTIVIFTNKPLTAIQILKTDAVTNAPLQGAVFTIQRTNGERIGDKYTTDVAGKILVSDLYEGVYIISEVKSPNEYILDAQPQTVEVKSGKLTIAEFTNKPYPYLYIKKIDATTGQLVAGAQFTVANSSGQIIANVTSLASGAVSLKVAPGVYVITEVKPPIGYELNDPVQTVEVLADGSTVYHNSGSAVSGNTATFANKPLNTIEIVKLDAVTHNPLSNAAFTVDKANGERIGEYRTDSSGKIIISDLTEGIYVISEKIPPSGYILNESPKSINVSGGKLVSVEFLNKPLSGIQIIKLDSITNKPLQGARFTVTNADGERIGTFTTEADGKVIISDLDEGVYVVGEISAPDGYQLDESPKNVTVVSGKLATVEFVNKPYSGIEILKTDEFSHIPLTGAKFDITRANGEKISEVTTDRTGKALVPNLDEGVYIVSEVFAPYGYVKSEIPQTVTVKSGKLTQVEFTNRPFSGIEIIKKDYFTKTALNGATFTVERSNGEKIGEFTTDETGKIIVSGLTDDTYIISETVAPVNYVISESPKTVVVTSGKLTSVTFLDKPLAGIEILKVDKYTHLALSGATFEVTRANGEKIATVKTDSSGKAVISNLDDGVYILSETIAPSGYQIDEVSKTIEVKSSKLTEVQFEDKPLSTLKILKLDSITRAPIADVEFTISKMNGEKIMNEFGSLTFKTDIAGAIYIPRLTEGYYVVTEIKTATGYFFDSEPKTVLVESAKDTVLEVLNTPMSALLIVKTDKNTGKPLAGVVFDVKKADGTFVVGDIKDSNQPGTPNNSQSKSTSENGDVTGSYTTDANGRIQINGLAAGEYHVVERKTIDGYELDKNVYSVTVLPGKIATLQLTNTPKSGIRLTKIDSISKKPIFGVEFMLLDKNGKVVNVYYTDDMGVIDFPNDIPEGRYTIRETRSAPGYAPDDIPRTVEFVAGQVTNITWENTPELGQIQILKKSGDANEINGLPAGTPLADAVFEIYNYKTGALVDRIVSGTDGRAVSNPLPLGRYFVKEVQPPKYYILSDKTLDIEIEFPNQIIKQEFVNYSANTGVSIKKVGNVEAMPGDVIRYDIKEVRNTSTVPLTDFYWRDTLPTNAVRLNKIVTGTYSQSLKYKIVITTNKGDTRVIADNLSTTKNNVIDCSNAALGLKSDEFVTSFSFIFGTVKAGFAQVEIPQVYVKVLPNLQNGLEFANKADIGGRYNGEWVIGNAVWTVKIFNPNSQPQNLPSKLPKTGF